MNYLEFGLLHKNKKKIYEIKKGHLYDDYMLSRYFNDIFLVSKYKKNKDLAKIVKYLHDKKDLKFNLINLLLLSKKAKINFMNLDLLCSKKFYFLN